MNLFANVELSCYLAANSQRSMVSIHSILKANRLVTIAHIRGTLATFTGKLYRVAARPPTQPFDVPSVLPTEVGTATLLFNGANNATLTYSVDGVQVSKAIERQPF